MDVEGAGDGRVGLRKPPPASGRKVLLIIIDFAECRENSQIRTIGVSCVAKRETTTRMSVLCIVLVRLLQ